MSKIAPDQPKDDHQAEPLQVLNLSSVVEIQISNLDTIRKPREDNKKVDEIRQVIGGVLQMSGKKKGGKVDLKAVDVIVDHEKDRIVARAEKGFSKDAPSRDFLRAYAELSGVQVAVKTNTGETLYDRGIIKHLLVEEKKRK